MVAVVRVQTGSSSLLLRHNRAASPARHARRTAGHLPAAGRRRQLEHRHRRRRVADRSRRRRRRRAGVCARARWPRRCRHACRRRPPRRRTRGVVDVGVVRRMVRSAAAGDGSNTSSFVVRGVHLPRHAVHPPVDWRRYRELVRARGEMGVGTRGTYVTPSTKRAARGARSTAVPASMSTVVPLSGAVARARATSSRRCSLERSRREAAGRV